MTNDKKKKIRLCKNCVFFETECHHCGSGSCMNENTENEEPEYDDVCELHRYYMRSTNAKRNK